MRALIWLLAAYGGIRPDTLRDALRPLPADPHRWLVAVLCLLLVANVIAAAAIFSALVTP